jgi:uncharacterized membrane protein YqgA involved in biofilm formation
MIVCIYIILLHLLSTFSLLRRQLSRVTNFVVMWDLVAWPSVLLWNCAIGLRICKCISAVVRPASFLPAALAYLSFLSLLALW